MSHTDRRALRIFKDTSENDHEEGAVSLLPYSFLSHEVRSAFLLGEVIKPTELQHLWTSLNLSDV